MAAEDLDRDKLAKVLALAASPNDGEARAALGRAREMLAAAGLEFRDLVHSNRRFPERRAAYLEVLVRDLKARLALSEAEAQALRRKAQETARDFAGQIARLGIEKQQQAQSLQQRIAALETRLAGAEVNRTVEPEPVRSGPAPSAPVPSAPVPSAQGGTSRRRAAVIALLENPETTGLSNREIARRVGVSPQTVSNWRHKLAETAPKLKAG